MLGASCHLGEVGGEVAADVPHAGGTQKGVNDGVNQRVAVAVALETLGVGNPDASQHQWAPLHQPVDIVAYPDTHP